MLFYHPAFDLNHAYFRIMLLLNALPADGVEPEKLRILDFFLLFPAEVRTIRQSDKQYKSAFNSYAQYEEMSNPSKVFYQIDPIYSSALKMLKSRGIVITKSLESADEVIGIDYSQVPAEIKTRIEATVIENENLIKFLVSQLGQIPLHGVDGLKDRTKLLPFKNDRK